MSWATDDRWSPGASGASVPDDAAAAYSARWIDRGDTIPADVVPDRQGFAYNEPAECDRLIALLESHGANTLHHGLDHDDVTAVVDADGFSLAMRRAGGCIYVDAWLVAA